MSAKENFNQAMNEVFPFYKNNAKGKNESGSEGPDEIKENTPDTIKFEPYKMAPARDFRSVYDAIKQDSSETALITRDTKVIGTIVSKSNIDISGEIIGDVESQQKIKISGKIEGNVAGKNIEVNEATIKGNINALEHLNVSSKSTIIGNISAASLDFNGRINGNIIIKEDVQIQRDSNVIGDISAAALGIEKGAFIKGNVNTLSEKKNVEKIEVPDK